MNGDKVESDRKAKEQAQRVSPKIAGVRISMRARALAEQLEASHDKVERLRAQIAAGTFKIDRRKISNALLADARAAA